jgi:hypothetical protein
VRRRDGRLRHSRGPQDPHRGRGDRRDPQRQEVPLEAAQVRSRRSPLRPRRAKAQKFGPASAARLLSPVHPPREETNPEGVGVRAEELSQRVE